MITQPWAFVFSSTACPSGGSGSHITLTRPNQHLVQMHKGASSQREMAATLLLPSYSAGGLI